VAKVTLAATEDVPKPALQSLSLEYTSGNLFVVSPNGGEELEAGATHQIVWSAQGHDAAYPVTLAYSVDGGRTYKTITDSTDNDGSHVWVLPDDVRSEEAFVKISDRNDPSTFDVSDDPFSILPAEELAQRQPKEAQRTKEEEEEYTDDLLSLLETLTEDPDATPHDIAVKIADSKDYEAGDLVLIRPTGMEWSEAEKNSFLIIQADLSPKAIQTLMSPAGSGRRKFKIDLEFFDLKPRSSDEGKAPVLRHYKKKENLKILLEDRTEDTPVMPATPSPVHGTK